MVLNLFVREELLYGPTRLRKQINGPELAAVLLARPKSEGSFVFASIDCMHGKLGFGALRPAPRIRNPSF